MPVKIIRVYRGTNIIQARWKSGQVKWGYRITFGGSKSKNCKTYIRAKWDTRKAAEEALARLRLEHADATDMPYRYRDLSFDDLFAAWKRRAEARRTSAKRIGEMEKLVERFDAIAPNRILSRITISDLMDYQNSRLRGDDPKHNHTINKELAMLRTLMLSAAALFPGFQWVPPRLERDDRLPTLYESREVIIDEEQHALIVAALTEDASIKASNERYARRSPQNISAENARRAFILDAYVVACETALRISELASIAKKDVSFTRGIGSPFGLIRLISAKTKKPQSVPMTWMVAEILKRRSEATPGLYLFRAPGQSLKMAILGIRRNFQRACERAGVPYGLDDDGIVFHTTRHTTTTRLVNSRIPISTVMAITRHSKSTMMLRYSHPTAETMREGIEALSLESEPEKDRKRGAR